MAAARDILVFDLDDTLYAERQFALSGFRAAERWACAELGLEAGYLSRMLRAFERDGLLTRDPAETDKRQTILSLTANGRAAFAPLDERSRQEIGHAPHTRRSFTRRLPHSSC